MKRFLVPTLVHGGLLVATFFTIALAGVSWLNKDPNELNNFHLGISYSLLVISILLSHESGHYFAARCHRVRTTLPYFLPFPTIYGISSPFGTLGAVIRLKERMPSRRATFDIGASGPLAGMAVSMIILVVGFRTLPTIDYLYAIHPEYAKMPSIPTGGLTFGNNLLFLCLSRVVPPSGVFVPPMNEVYHYPFLCAGWFGLLITALNLIPVGQLDGGHILLALTGKRHIAIERTVTLGIGVLGLLGLLPFLGIGFTWGWMGWLLWFIILILMLRRPSPDFSDQNEGQLNQTRILLGVLCLLILASAFSPAPFLLQ